MTIKTCTCCKNSTTTKEYKKIGERNELGLWLNCKKCGSTILLTLNKTYQQKVEMINSLLRKSEGA